MTRNLVFSLFAWIGLLICCCRAAQSLITVKVIPSPILPNPAVELLDNSRPRSNGHASPLLVPSTQLILDGGNIPLPIPINSEGEFKIPIALLTPGVHLLQITSVGFEFDPVRVDMSEEGTLISATLTSPGWSWANVKGLVSLTPSKSSFSSPHWIEVRPARRLDYYTARPKMSVWGMVAGNPMLLMAVASLGLVMLLPALMRNMDPEVLKEFQQHQAVSALSDRNERIEHVATQPLIDAKE